MKAPTTWKAEILLHLIENGKVSHYDFPFLCDLRKHISVLINEHGVQMTKTDLHKISKFGRPYQIKMYHLANKEEAIKIYDSL